MKMSNSLRQAPLYSTTIGRNARNGSQSKNSGDMGADEERLKAATTCEATSPPLRAVQLMSTSILTTEELRPPLPGESREDKSETEEGEQGGRENPTSKLVELPSWYPSIASIQSGAMPVHKGPSHTAVEVEKMYDLRWARGKRGKARMKAVKLEIEEWLGAQEAKVKLSGAPST